jgi:hypothetical protein
MRKVVTVVAATVAVLAATASARAYERMPTEQWTVPYGDPLAHVPACEAPEVLAFIQQRFADTEANFWNSSLTIAGIEKAHATGYRPWGLDFIPRRFCTGVALTSDGHRRQLDYSVIQEDGFAGYSWNVEWCVNGTDRAWAYAPGCKMARP